MQRREAAPPPSADAWTPAKQIAAYQATRILGWNPAWITALQAMLEIDPKGIASRDLADAVAEKEKLAGRPQTGRIDGENTAWLIAEFPVLADVPREMEAADDPAARARSRSDEAPEDLAIKRLNQGESYADYASNTLRSSTFCGLPIVGHPLFLARLRAAEAYLSSYNEGLTGTALGEKLGVFEVSSYRSNTHEGDQLLHGIGFAIDVNQSANDWNFGAACAGRFQQAMMHAGELFGEPGLIGDSEGLTKSAKGKTTEEAFEEIAASNDALRRDRAFANDKPALEAHLASEECPAGAKQKGLDRWFRMITQDHRALVSRTGKTEEGEAPAGFMDHDARMVAALRDAGGLRWGGTDFRHDINGDLMHFDAYNSEPGRTLRDKVREQRENAGEPST